MSDVNQALYNALRKGPQTEAKLRKASKLEDDEFDAAISDWKLRQWVEADDSAKDTQYRITQLASADMGQRYPD
jgi:hypothetical protein